MAAWLVRAIVVENVSARRDGTMLYLPVGPEFRLEKEVKNVVTSLAKTCHYWCYHMAPSEQAAAAAVMAAAPLLESELPDALPSPAYESVVAKLLQSLRQQTGLAVEPRECGWLGMQCTDVATAIWLMRALLAENILVRREEAVLCLPVQGSYADADCERLVAAVVRVLRLEQARARDSN